jgi:hypothetical protein
MFKSINKKVVTALLGLGLGLGFASAPALASCTPLQCVKEYRACVAAGYAEEDCHQQLVYCNDICFG